MSRRSMPSDLIRGWIPVRRQEHAPTRESGAHPDSAGTGCALTEARSSRAPPRLGRAEPLDAVEIQLAFGAPAGLAGRDSWAKLLVELVGLGGDLRRRHRARQPLHRIAHELERVAELDLEILLDAVRRDRPVPGERAQAVGRAHDRYHALEQVELHPLAGPEPAPPLLDGLT